jgi:hypothetical protein
MSGRLVLAALLGGALAAGCTTRRLDVLLSLAADSCTIEVPSGGSLFYQVTSAEVDGGTGVCGACLPVAERLATPEQMVAFLRVAAPSCPGIKPGSSLRVRLEAWASPGCAATATRLFCSLSPPLPIPDGRTDAVASAVLTCDPSCSGGCVPTSCAAIGKNCGAVSDGCSKIIECGQCSPPERCGGGGVLNVCGRPGGGAM